MKSKARRLINQTARALLFLLFAALIMFGAAALLDALSDGKAESEMSDAEIARALRMCAEQGLDPMPVYERAYGNSVREVHCVRRREP